MGSKPVGGESRASTCNIQLAALLCGHACHAHRHLPWPPNIFRARCHLPCPLPPAVREAVAVPAAAAEPLVSRPNVAGVGV